MKFRIYIVIFLILNTSSCGPRKSDTDSKDQPVEQTIEISTNTTFPKDTPEPTDTPVPAKTTRPSRTPTPSDTAIPTITLIPTLTPWEDPILAPELNDDSPIPVAGVYVPKLQAFDEAMVNFMVNNDIPSGSLAISKGGRIILEHGYGWFDLEKTIPVNPGVMMRIASVTKPITLAAIRQLVKDGMLLVTTKVFCLDDQVDECILPFKPLEDQQVDPLLKNISVLHLMNHAGGWDRGASFDPMVDSINIASELGIKSPPSKHDVAQYMLGVPLDFIPGSWEVYSNFGYLLLGMVIEEITGMSYENYIKQNIFTPLGIVDAELAVTLPEERINPKEISYYYCPGLGENVFNPGTYTCWPDGGWYIEAMDSHGGWVASSRAIVTFLDNFCIDTGHPRTSSCGYWWFFGSLDGTFSMAYQIDDLSFAVLFNRRNSYSYQIYNVIESAARNIAVWP